MRVRLPDGKSLKGDALAMFSHERDRINTLLDIKPTEAQVASR